MNKYNFDEIANRINSDSHKYIEGEKILPVWVADMDFHVLPEIKDAIKERADIDAYGYVEINEEYFTSFINFFDRHHGIRFDKEDLIFSTGVVASIDSIFKHYLNKKDKVLMLTPIYHTFFSCISNNGLDVVELPLDFNDNHYSINTKKIEEVIKKEHIKCLLFCNPHNPVGLIYTKDELNEVARICYENNVLLISDEIHGELVDPGYKYTPIFKVNSKYWDNIITLTSPSKCFNLAGLHTSFIIVKNKIKAQELQSFVYSDDIGEPNYFGPYASIAAYSKGDEWLKEVNAYIATNKEYVYKYIKENIPKISVVITPATYLMWINIDDLCINSGEFTKKLKEAGLWVSPGTQFRGNGDKFIRLNVATSLTNVMEACNLLDTFIKNL